MRFILTVKSCILLYTDPMKPCPYQVAIFCTGVNADNKNPSQTLGHGEFHDRNKTGIRSLWKQTSRNDLILN